VNLLVWRANRFLVDVVHFTPRLLIRLGKTLDFGTTYRTTFILRRPSEAGDRTSREGESPHRR
jgi:hypothetical protein